MSEFKQRVNAKKVKGDERREQHGLSGRAAKRDRAFANKSNGEDGGFLYYNKRVNTWPFSNLAKVNFRAPACEGQPVRSFNSVEQGYVMAQLLYVRQLSLIPRLLALPHPEAVKGFQLRHISKEQRHAFRASGRAVKTMKALMLAKFRQNQEARNALLGTQDAYLAEATFCKTWGIGLDEKGAEVLETCKNKRKMKGQNLQGLTLMEVRQILRAEQEAKERLKSSPAASEEVPEPPKKRPSLDLVEVPAPLPPAPEQAPKPKTRIPLISPEEEANLDDSIQILREIPAPVVAAKKGLGRKPRARTPKCAVCRKRHQGECRHKALPPVSQPEPVVTEPPTPKKEPVPVAASTPIVAPGVKIVEIRGEESAFITAGEESLKLGATEPPKPQPKVGFWGQVSGPKPRKPVVSLLATLSRPLL